MKKNHLGIKSSSAGGDGRRVSRFENEIQSIVSLYIIQNLQSELPGLVTVARVHVPADLRTANVYVSLLNIAEEKSGDQKVKDLESTIDTLQSWAKDIQSEIDRKLKMKYLPKLTFFPDESTEKILKIEKILSNIDSSQNIDEDEDL